MKFSKILEEYQLPEYRGKYLPYYFLKKRLEDLVAGRNDAATKELLSRIIERGTGTVSSTLGERSVELNKRLAAFRVSGTEGVAASLEQDEVLQVWCCYLEAEVIRIDGCVRCGLQDLHKHFVELGSQHPSSSSEGHFMHLNVLEALGRCAEGLERLRGFAELNHAALYKILKKYDKMLKCSDGVRDFYPKFAEGTYFADWSELDEFDRQIKEAFVHRSNCDGVGVTPAVARLAAGLGRASRMQGHTQDPAMRSERFLYFFLGSSTALLCSILLLIALPSEDPATFSTSYFLCAFPVFRVVFFVLLVVWGMGAVARTCEDNQINYKFLLGIDPRCRVGSKTLFSYAATLTSVWIFIFGLYVVDYKWTVFNEHSPTRRSWHFVLYPIILIGFTAIVVLRPSNICRCRYKVQLIEGVKRTCLAPLYMVNFGDNLTGDVLTSLAKPLQDVLPAICYLGSEHPQTDEKIAAFVKYGSTCPRWETTWFAPLVGAAPFVFRLMQCARRYRDTNDYIHLLNFGKYSASLLVVVVSSCFRSTLLVILASIFATAYAATWDVVMDWGLGPKELSLLARGQSPSPMMPVSVDGGAPVRANTLSQLDLEDITPSAGKDSAPRKRQFSTQAYWCAVLIDVFLRLSWVSTLMPITLLSDNIVNRDILHAAVPVLEIFRRTVWSVLRLEHEQVANASGYRALLWVPTQVEVVQDPSYRSRTPSPNVAESPRAFETQAPTNTNTASRPLLLGTM